MSEELYCSVKEADDWKFQKIAGTFWFEVATRWMHRSLRCSVSEWQTLRAVASVAASLWHCIKGTTQKPRLFPLCWTTVAVWEFWCAKCRSKFCMNVEIAKNIQDWKQMYCYWRKRNCAWKCYSKHVHQRRIRFQIRY